MTTYSIAFYQRKHRYIDLHICVSTRGNREIVQILESTAFHIDEHPSHEVHKFQNMK